MIDRATKFRYANALAGTFVVTAFVLLIVGVFVAAKARGWLEGKIVLRARFDAAQGTFGLQEGSEVRVRDILAGTVGKIAPNDRGEMETTYVIGRRFHRLIAEDSVALVRKKFGVAGDAYVEITEGQGPMIQDGAYIECRKDEDLMDVARKLLGDVQDIVLPTLREVQQIVHHVNQVTAGLAAGEGPAGAILKDPAITEGIKDMLSAGTGLVRDSQRAVQETTRILKALQKHWLLRRYVEPEEGLAGCQAGGLAPREAASAREEWAGELRAARAANDGAAIANAAVGLAYALLASGATNEVPALLEESRAEALAARTGLAETYLLESLWLSAVGEPEAAAHAAQSAQEAAGKRDKILLARVHAQQARALCAAGRIPEARSAAERAERLAGGEAPPGVSALVAEAWALVLRAERRPDLAAARYDRQAESLRGMGRMEGMAQALEKAGDCYAEAGRPALAADRYYRAARSLEASGASGGALRPATRALPMAREAGDDYLIRQIERLISTLTTRPPPAETTRPAG